MTWSYLFLRWKTTAGNEYSIHKIIWAWSGILLRKNATEHLTVANHGFLSSDEVYHPDETGNRIGQVSQRYPEFDVAMVKLTPANADMFTNRIYFKADCPQRLQETNGLQWGALKVDSISTSLVPFLYMCHKTNPAARSPWSSHCPVEEVQNARTFWRQ